VPFHKDRTYVYAEKLIKELKEKNYHIIAVSGSPIEIVKEFKDYEDLKNNILPLEIERSFLNRTHIAEKDYSYCHALEYEYGKFRLANQGKDPEEILDNISNFQPLIIL
jgi:hypothetical protein